MDEVNNKRTVTQQLPAGAKLTVELNPHGEDILTIEFWVEDLVKVEGKSIPQLVRIVSTGGRIERIIRPGDECGLSFSAHGHVIAAEDMAFAIGLPNYSPNQPGIPAAAVKWKASGATGMSSNCIWNFMVGEPNRSDVPYDLWDYERCWSLLVLVPEWLKRLPEMATHHKEWVGFAREWRRLEQILTGWIVVRYDKTQKAKSTELWKEGSLLLAQCQVEGLRAAGWTVKTHNGRMVSASKEDQS